MDHSHAINQVIEKSAEFNKHLYMAFIEYGEALDRAEIPAVLVALHNEEVQKAYAKVLGNLYKDSTATFLLNK